MKMISNFQELRQRKGNSKKQVVARNFSKFDLLVIGYWYLVIGIWYLVIGIWYSGAPPGNFRQHEAPGTH